MGLWNDFVFMPQRRRQCAPSGQDIARHRLIMADRNNVPLVRQDHEADPFDMSVWEAFWSSSRIFCSSSGFVASFCILGLLLRMIGA